MGSVGLSLAKMKERCNDEMGTNPRSENNLALRTSTSGKERGQHRADRGGCGCPSASV